MVEAMIIHFQGGVHVESVWTQVGLQNRPFWVRFLGSAPAPPDQRVVLGRTKVVPDQHTSHLPCLERDRVFLCLRQGSLQPISTLPSVTSRMAQDDDNATCDADSGQCPRTSSN